MLSLKFINSYTLFM